MITVDELYRPLPLLAGKTYKLIVAQPEHIAHLELAIHDLRSGFPPWSWSTSSRATILTFEGTTGEEGRISHPKVLAGYYTLTVDERTYPIATNASAHHVQSIYVLLKQETEQVEAEAVADDNLDFVPREPPTLRAEEEGSDG